MPSFNAALRKSILLAARDPRMKTLMRRYGMRLGARRFVAGETLDECVVALRRLNDAGFNANTTILGEDVRDEAATLRVVEGYEEVLRRITAERLRVNISLKLTHLGLAIDEALARRNLERILGTARGLGRFVRIDMEESTYVDATIRTYRAMRDAGLENVGMVLQAYLRRSADDLRALLPLRPNIRFVKGAYLEAPGVAFPERPEVDTNLVRLIDTAIHAEGHTAIATHDERIVDRFLDLVRRERIPEERFEFQFLYGIRGDLQRRARRAGHAVLVATPFGPDWYPYLMRRLAERPANLLFFLRNALRP